MTEIHSPVCVMDSEENPDAIHSQIIYCYAGHRKEILRLCRRLFIMSPCTAVWSPNQIKLDEWKHPIFFFSKNHPSSVPWDEFLPFLTEHQATVIEIEFGQWS